jgi:hypothetical protein
MTDTNDEMQPHDYSILTVVHELVTAVHDDLKSDELLKRADWLEWRVSGGWKRSKSNRTRGFDVMVQCLAKEALRLYAQHREHQATDPSDDAT